MYRRTFLTGLPIPLFGGCLGRDTPSSEGTASNTEGTASTTDAPETTTVAHTGPIDPADGIDRVRGGDDSVGVHLDGYDSSKYSEARFFRSADSTGVPADLSRSQVTSTSQLQNALAYFGPEVDEVSVRMPLSDGYALSDALDSHWSADGNAQLDADEEEVYRFEEVQFTVLVIYYE